MGFVKIEGEHAGDAGSRQGEWWFFPAGQVELYQGIMSDESGCGPIKIDAHAKFLGRHEFDEDFAIVELWNPAREKKLGAFFVLDPGRHMGREENGKIDG